MTPVRAISVSNPEAVRDRQLLLSYAAGLIDGEGCISVYENSHNGHYQLRITVEMVERGGLDVLHSLFGGKWYSKKHKPPRRDTLVWMVFNRYAERAIREMLPYLRVKKRQAEIGLMADWSSYTGGRRVDDNQKSIRQCVALTMRCLNERGCS